MKFFHNDHRQDLIEYTLLLAFVALASLALFTSAGNSITTLHSTSTVTSTTTSGASK